MSVVEPEVTAASGTGAAPVAATDPSSAGTQNSDSGQGDPGPIPYARFKEVNDQLRGYKELESMGYTLDSLRGLAQWEMEFQQDPAGSWLRVAANMEGLPEDIQMAVKDHLSIPYGDGSDDDSDDTDEDATSVAALSTEDQEILEWAKAERARRVTEGRQATLNWIVDEWRKLDTEKGVKTPDEAAILSFISGAAGTGSTKEEILESARGVWLKAREDAHSEVVKPVGMGLPAPVPGGAATTGSEPTKPKTFEEMNAIIKGVTETGGEL